MISSSCPEGEGEDHSHHRKCEGRQTFYSLLVPEILQTALPWLRASAGGEGALQATRGAPTSPGVKPLGRPAQTLPGGSQEGHHTPSGQSVPLLIAPPTSASDAFECRISARESPGWDWITSTSICLVLHHKKRKTRGHRSPWAELPREVFTGQFKGSLWQ